MRVLQYNEVFLGEKGSRSLVLVTSGEDVAEIIEKTLGV